MDLPISFPSCMTTTQCRLCLADVPHDYDHPLEQISSEKALEIDVDNSDDEVLNGHEQYPPGLPQGQSWEWPNSAAITTILFTLYILNAIIFITYLVIQDILRSGSHSTGMTTERTIISIAVAGICALINFILAFLGRKYFKSSVLGFYCFITGAVWCVVVGRVVSDI